mmetsp:Transcript_36465/g.97055  ORF Transcript_36465/g.97055 Transcript_36465/m.97055 type:complete len:246 (+) Transcript_36465:878-1615(+)
MRARPLLGKSRRISTDLYPSGMVLTASHPSDLTTALNARSAITRRAARRRSDSGPLEMRHTRSSGKKGGESALSTDTRAISRSLATLFPIFPTTTAASPGAKRNRRGTSPASATFRNRSCSASVGSASRSSNSSCCNVPVPSNSTSICCKRKTPASTLSLCRESRRTRLCDASPATGSRTTSTLHCSSSIRALTRSPPGPTICALALSGTMTSTEKGRSRERSNASGIPERSKMRSRMPEIALWR